MLNAMLARRSEERRGPWLGRRDAPSRPGGWRPHHAVGGPRLGEGRQNGVADLGLSLLSVSAVMSAWSSISPSVATYQSFFSRTEAERAIADRTLLIALGASTVVSAGVYLVFKRLVPALVGEASAVVLFALGMHATHSTPPAVSTMEQRRIEQLSPQPLPQPAPLAGPLRLP